MGRGVHRGFITHEELNKSLGKRNLSCKNLEQAFIHRLLIEQNYSLLIDADEQTALLPEKKNGNTN